MELEIQATTCDDVRPKDIRSFDWPYIFDETGDPANLRRNVRGVINDTA